MTGPLYTFGLEWAIVRGKSSTTSKKPNKERKKMYNNKPIYLNCFENAKPHVFWSGRMDAPMLKSILSVSIWDGVMYMEFSWCKKKKKKTTLFEIAFTSRAIYVRFLCAWLAGFYSKSQCEIDAEWAKGRTYTWIHTSVQSILYLCMFITTVIIIIRAIHRILPFRQLSHDETYLIALSVDVTSC